MIPRHTSIILLLIIIILVITTTTNFQTSADEIENTTNNNNNSQCQSPDGCITSSSSSEEEEEEEQDMNVERQAIEQSCRDKSEDCSYLADQNGCTKHESHMKDQCPFTCGFCSIVINSDADFGIPQTATGLDQQQTLQTIQSSITYMQNTVLTNPLYQNIKHHCRNQHELCSYWAHLGECTHNPSYMTMNCAPACQTCEQLDIQLRCPMKDDYTNEDGLSSEGDLNRMFERLVERDGYYDVHFDIKVLSRPPAVERSGNNNVEIIEDEETIDGPWIVTFENFLKPSEIDRFLHHGSSGDGYQRSKDVGKRKFDGTHDGHVSEQRTSYNAWCGEECKNDTLIMDVLERMSNFTGLGVNHSEDIQLLRYEVGQYYVEHHDYIDYHVDRPCGVRILTFFFYLNDVEEGGGTRFPQLGDDDGGLTVMPKRGRALLWPSVLDEDPNVRDARTHHEALKVEKGIKYGANAWIHMRDFQTALANNCHN